MTRTRRFAMARKVAEARESSFGTERVDRATSTAADELVDEVAEENVVALVGDLLGVPLDRQDPRRIVVGLDGLDGAVGRPGDGAEAGRDGVDGLVVDAVDDALVLAVGLGQTR